MKRINRVLKLKRAIVEALALACCNAAFSQAPEHTPYEHAVGTVHQLGFVGGLSVMQNPNIRDGGCKRSYTDYSMGAVYNFQNYITKQLSIESTVSITMQTAKSLTEIGAKKKNQKMILPADVRISVGPCEDMTLFLGAGLQWNIVSRDISEVDETSPEKSESETVHQLSGNSTAGISFLGPSKYRIHFSAGLKFHFPISNSKVRDVCSKEGEVDVSCDKSSMSWTGSITYDLDKKKSAVIILSYELPLEREQRNTLMDCNLLHRTQMASVGLMFYLGGSR